MWSSSPALFASMSCGIMFASGPWPGQELAVLKRTNNRGACARGNIQDDSMPCREKRSYAPLPSTLSTIVRETTCLGASGKVNMLSWLRSCWSGWRQGRPCATKIAQAMAPSMTISKRRQASHRFPGPSCGRTTVVPPA